MGTGTSRTQGQSPFVPVPNRNQLMSEAGDLRGLGSGSCCRSEEVAGADPELVVEVAIGAGLDGYRHAQGQVQVIADLRDETGGQVDLIDVTYRAADESIAGHDN